MYVGAKPLPLECEGVMYEYRRRLGAVEPLVSAKGVHIVGVVNLQHRPDGQESSGKRSRLVCFNLHHALLIRCRT